MEALRIVAALVVVLAVAAGAYMAQNTAPAGIGGGETTTTSLVPLATTTTTSGGGTQGTVTSESGTPTTTTETVTATEGGEGDNATSSVETYQAGQGVEIVVDYSLRLDDGVLYIKSYTITYQDGVPVITLTVQLPNPCYQAKLNYEPEKDSLVLNITSPPPDTMCIQVVRLTSLVTALDPAPQDNTVNLVITKDGAVLKTLTLDIPPPVTSQP